MATYIIAIASDTKRNLVDTWFKRYLASNEFSDRPLGFSSIFCASALLHIHDHLQGAGEFGLGHLVDHGAHSVRFPPFGGPDSVFGCEGTFVHASWNDSEARITNDIFGIVPIYYFLSSELCVFSDSLLAITMLMRAAGIPRELDTQSFVARSEAVTITAQPISTRTFIKGVSYAPPGTRISVASGARGLLPTIRHDGMPSLFEAHEGSYGEQIWAAAEQSIGYMGAMLRLPGSRMKMDLSGGLDSRLCLAFALRFPEHKRLLEIGSAVHRMDDYAVASDLCSTFRLNLNPPRAPMELRRTNQLALWFASCAGVYDPLLCPPAKRRVDNIVMVGGHGGEVYSGQYDWRPTHAIGSKFNSDVRDAFHAEMTSALSAVGVDSDAPSASEWHYLGWRSGIHSGRFVMTSCMAIRPILTRRLVRLPRDVADSSPRYQPRVIRDMLIMLNPKLASMPYSDPRKNVDAKRLSAVARASPAQMEATEAYTIQGAPENGRIRPIPSLIACAEQYGFTGDFSTSRLLELAEKYRDVAPNDVMVHVQRLFAFASSGASQPISASARPSMALGKLLSLGLLAE